MDFFNDIGKRLSGAARSVQEKTRDSMELSRLNGEVRNATSELDKLYGALGRAYYDTQASGGDQSALSSFVEQIGAALAHIEDLNQQKDRLRQQRRCPACNAVQSLDARFCSVCGARMPEKEAPAPEAEPEAEYCPDCGSLRKPGAAFCEVCGKRFAPEDAPAAEPEITWPGEKPDTSSEESPREDTTE